jgi:hypothetical protein
MKYYVLIIILSLSSCSYFLKKIDKQSSSQIEINKNEKTYCELKNNKGIILVSKDKNFQRVFKRFLNKSKNNNIQLNNIEKAVLWSMVQMNVRPDLSSPSSRFHTVISYGNKSKFWDFTIANKQSGSVNSYPFIYGMERLLKYYNSKKSLKSLARVLDLYFPNSMLVSDELESFLKDNQKAIRQSKVLRKRFMRGDELLKKGERLPKVNFSSVVNLYLKSKSNIKYKSNNHLFPFKQSTKVQVNCNFDMALYSNSIFLIEKDQIRNHFYGLSIGKFSFMGANGQKISNVSSLNGQLFIKGQAKHRMAGICQYRTLLSNIWLFSDNSRDPGQHLYHLYQYGIEDAESAEALDTLLRFSRHLFLSQPLRLVYESERGTANQLDELLKLDFPIYNSFSLGNIWGHFYKNNTGQFIIDDRNKGNISCL